MIPPADRVRSLTGYTLERTIGWRAYRLDIWPCEGMYAVVVLSIDEQPICTWVAPYLERTASWTGSVTQLNFAWAYYESYRDRRLLV